SRLVWALPVVAHAEGTGITGRLYVAGREVRATTVEEAIRHGLAYASEDRKRYGLNLIQDITTNITAANLRALARHGVVDRYRETSVAERFRRNLRIKTPTVQTVVGQLSGGNQQKVALAKRIYT